MPCAGTRKAIVARPVVQFVIGLCAVCWGRAELGECWDIDFPLVCRKYGHSHTESWSRKPCIWPDCIATFHLCSDQVLTMEQPGADVRFLSSGVDLSRDLRTSISKEYPNWD